MIDAPAYMCEDCETYEDVEEYYTFDQAIERLCPACAGKAGYCMGCHNFCAGIESFDFSPMPGYCVECVRIIWDQEDDWDDWDDDDDYGDDIP